MSETEKCDALIFFGATGDLAKKQTFPALQTLVDEKVIDFSIFGVARANWTDDDLHSRAIDSLKANNQYDQNKFKKMAALLKYVEGDLNDDAVFIKLAQELKDAQRPLVYMAVPPSLFEGVAKRLVKNKCLREGRMVVEKPFGADYKSAVALNKALTNIMRDDQVYRIDHYLGKDSVENLASLHQVNTLIRASWKKNFIDHIQVTMAEKFGVSDRGSFYDAQGTIRDVVQNHILQILANLLLKHKNNSVETSDAESRFEALNLLSFANLDDAVFGQFDGYKSVHGVDQDSKTETFVAFKISVEEGDLQGVPIYIRAGKRLPITSTQVHVVMKQPKGVKNACTECLSIGITPHEDLSINLNAKAHGRSENEQTIILDSGLINADQMAPYVHLLGDAINGRRNLFSNQASVERCWQIVDPLMKRRKAPQSYAEGSWALSDAIQPPGGWLMNSRSKP